MDKNNSWNSNNCSSGGTASSRSSSYFQKGIKVAEHLSNLRQLMKIPIHAIDKAYVVAMDQMPATDHLEYYYISSPKALELFPNYNDIIKPIIAILEFQQRFYQSKSVLVLDLLTLLTIMSNGALIDKAKLLFTMYNISKSGLMIELEHRNFLLRVKYCLQKLRLVQTLDLNEKECDYLALEARTMLIENDNVCKIQYLPGLYFNDFYNWINTSNECQQLFIFFRVLTRLTDTMTVLADRTASLHSIMEEKMAYKINCITYPSINLFTYDKSTDGIHKDMSVQVVFRSQTAISLLVKVPATNCKVLYIKYDKVVLAPQPLYEIPAVIAERNKELNEKMTNKNIHCCDKYYVLSATKCHAIIDKHIHFGNTPYTRVDMDGLDSGNRYFFTIYNEQFRYPVVEAYTLEEKKKHLSNTYVLPTNVHEQAAKFIDSVIKDDAEQTFVHTGVVFDIHQECVTALTSMIVDCSLKLESIAFINIICSNFQEQCNKQFEQLVDKLLGYCSIQLGMKSADKKTEKEFSCATKKKQILFYDGINPINTKNLIEMLKKHLTANCFYSFQQEFERVYHTYFQNLLPPCSIVANGSVKLLFGNRTIEKATDRYQGANNKFMTCGEITSYFYERVQDQFHIDKEHIVIIISSPWDLMDRFHENIIEEEPNPTNFDPKGTEGEFFRENLVAYRKPVHDSLSNTIRGKHEIIHGEYLSRDYQYHTLNVDDATTSKKSKLAQDINNRKALNASFDTNFYLLLTLLFRWLRSGPDSKDGEMLNRQITIISTDWENGINFAIDSKVLNDQNVLTINHHCLKATRLEVIDSVDENIQVGNVDTTDGSAKRRGSRTITYSNRENDKLLDKLNNSLPGGMVLRNCKSSGNRAVDICDDPSSPLVSPLKFIEIEGDKNIEKDRMTGRKKDYCNSMMGQQLGLELKLPSLRILSGPTILEVGSDSVLIGLQIIGIGVARCLLFELPTNVNENDALSLLYMEREHLQLVGEVRKRNMSRSNFRDHLVRFHKLRSYCAYLAVVEPTQSATPMVAYCRTQLSSNSEVSAVILGSVGSPEYAQITPRLMKIRSIAQTYRSPSSSVYLLDITADNWLSSCKTRNMLINPIRELLRGGNVYHTEPHKFQNLFTMKPKLNLDRDTLKVEHDNMKNCFHDHITSFGKESTIHINMNGQFCYLSSTDSSVESIVELIDFILKLDYYPQVRSLIIFLSKPLVHHIRRRQYFADYVMEGPLHQAKDICKKFLLLLLDWKAKSKYYDCKIISLAAVSELKVFEIRNKSIDRINYPPLKKEQTPREHESLINNIGNQKSADIGESLMSSNDGITNMKRKLAVKFTENKDQEVLKKVNPTGYYRNKEGMLVKIEREIPKLTTITLQGAAKIADKNSKDNAGYESDAYAADGKLVGLPNSTLLDQINDEIEPALQKSEHRQRQGTTTQNILDNLMNIKESDPKELLSDVINEVNSSTEVDSLDDFIDCKIMQVLLPLYKFGTSKEENSDDILTFKGINFIDDAITYELLENVNADDHGVEIIMPLDEIYEKSITYNKKEPLVYRVEVIMKSIFDGAEMDTLGSAVQSLADSQASSTITIVKPDQNQTLYIRAIVEEIDLLDILMGPLIGLVTTNTAFISFEVNMSLESVTCVLQPRWSPGTSSTKSATLTDVKGHQVFQFKFENLTPNMIYTIYLPDICPDKVLGNFQTLPVVSSYLQVAFVGNDLFPEVPLINELLQQINHQQFPNFLQISLVNKLYRKQSIVNPPTKKRKNRSKLLSLDKMYDNGDNVSVDSATLSEHSIMSRDGNAWDWLSHHLTSKATPTIATFHLGSWSLLVKYFDVLFDAICEKAINLRLPFDKSTAIGQYYYKQFDELIKDTFRYVFNIPMVKEALALGVHLPLFHSDYLLPTNFFDIHHEEALLDSVPRENTEEVDAEQHSNSLQRSKISQQQDQVESDENKRAAVRKILKNSFEVSMKEYVIGMYGLEAASPVMSNGATESNASNEEAKKHRSQIWRASSLAVASLDIVSGRKKLKKNENEEEGEKMTNSKSFHLGFLDRTQWKLLKSIANDKSVTHIIIATESPIIPLTAIASDYHPPDVVEKGNFLPWSPTIHDLSIFMNFWIDWLRLGVTKNGPCGRNITLMSTSSIPYGTTVQDLRTGLKINQFCVSNFNIWSDITPDAIDTISSRQDIKMSGKIGNLRYNHFFGLDDTIPFECSRDKKSLTRLNSDSNAENKPEVEIPLKGFSTLKLWFDSWKALGVWSAISTDPKILDRKKKGDALLLVGPIIGAPTNINEGKTIAIPILLEADRKTKIKISITNNFTNEKVKLVYDLPARAPVVVVLKPLELHTRYNIDIYKGLKSSSMNSFVLSTHFHWDESNIGVLNCEPLTETMSSADFCMDIINRWRVPFNGLTAFVHTNCQPNISGIVNGMKYSSHLIASLQESKLKRLVDEDLRTQLMEILDTLRDYFRNNFAMPSYREVLRNAYNLFIQNIYPIVLVGDSMYNKNSMKQGTEGTAKYDEDENETEDIDNSDLVRLLGLMVARLNQEYYERLQNPNVNVYRAIYYGDFEELTAGNDFGNSDSVLFESSSLGQAPELTKAAESFEKYLADDQAVQELPNSGNYNYFFCHTGMKAIDAVILQWQRNMLPAPAIWTPWVAPNGKASVEQMRTINQKNMPGIAEQFEQSPIDSGVRILILVDEPNGSAADELLKMNTMISREYQEQVLEWQNQRPDRKLCIVCPSSKFGTKTIDIGVDLLPPVISREGLAMDGKDIDQNDAEATETPIDEENKANEDNRDVSSNEVVKPEAPKEASLKVHFVDSIYRSNEYVRKQLLAEIEKKKAKKKVSALAAKTKRAQQKREEEERARQAEIAGEIQSVMESQIPDGYLIVQCRTYKLTVDDSEIHVTLTRTHLLGTVIGDDEQQEAVFKDIQNGMPTYFDFLQLPEWVIRFSPVTDNDTIFVQDEVLLFMRQQGVTKAALDLVEEGKYLPTVRNIYERSRLSELSRPPDLREVDMDAPGVITLFMNDVIDRIWLEAVPPSIQPVVFTLNDAFIRSYCLYKTMGDVSVLSSSASFAKAFQRSLVLGVAFKMAYEMSRMESYENILDSDDLPTIKLKKKLIIEEKLADEALVKEVKRKLREYEEKVAAEAGIILPPEEEEEKKKGSGDNEEPGANVEDAPTRENHLGYESDLEELDKEVKEMEEEERKAEEEESVGEDDDELENVKVDDNFAEEERKLQEQRELALQEIDRKQRTEEVAQENSEESIKKALIARNELAADVLNKTVENVLEIQLVEAVTLLAQLLEEERLQTALAEAKAQKSDSDRANSSTVFMLRMQEERILYRRLYGKRISFLG